MRMGCDGPSVECPAKTLMVDAGVTLSRTLLRGRWSNESTDICGIWAIMYPPLPSPEDLAAEWIAWQRTGGAPAGPENSAQYLLTEFPEDAPYLTWETILVVMQAYPEDAYYSTEPTEAQQVCGILAAGPVEDLLSFHGPHFIAAFEVQARLDTQQEVEYYLHGGILPYVLRQLAG